MPGRKLLCGSRVFKESGALKVVLPDNLIESLKLKENDWIMWREFYVSRKGDIVLKAEVIRHNT